MSTAISFTISTAQRISLYENMITEYQRRYNDAYDENSRRVWQGKIDEHKRWIQQLKGA